LAWFHYADFPPTGGHVRRAGDTGNVRIGAVRPFYQLCAIIAADIARKIVPAIAGRIVRT
jgi:hypothetical protein